MASRQTSAAETDDEQRPGKPPRQRANPHADIFSDTEVSVRRKTANTFRDPFRRQPHSGRHSIASSRHTPTLEPAMETDYEETDDTQSEHMRISEDTTEPGSPVEIRQGFNPQHRRRGRCTPLTTPVPERNLMENHNSYHGAISGDEAVRRLLKTNYNSYLCRFSPNNGIYVITVLKRDPQKTVGHFGLHIDRKSQRKYRVIGMEKHSDSIDKLLSFYENNQIHPQFNNIGQRLTVQEFTQMLQKGICTYL